MCFIFLYAYKPTKIQEAASNEISERGIYREQSMAQSLILSSFTHPQVVPNLYEFLCSEHKGRYLEES